MSELVIKTHDFNTAKGNIKKFSKKADSKIAFKSISSKKSGGEWLKDVLSGGGLSTQHKVTGAEFNSFITEIQSYLKGVNSTQIELIREFGQVYTALEALDKDYIQAILISIKATEATSKRIETTQEEIGKIVENQKGTLQLLSNFKKKLDSYSHLGDIDKIWVDCQKWHNDMYYLSCDVDRALSRTEENTQAIDKLNAIVLETDGKVTQLSNSLSEQIERIENILSFMNELETIIHLNDIDTMWDSLESAHIAINNLCTELNEEKQLAAKQQQDIEQILSFIEDLSKYEHLKDIDILWDSSQRHSNQIEALQNKDEELSNLIQYNKELVDQALKSEKEQTEVLLQQISKKIKYAYGIAGSSMALVLIELLIILLR